MANTNFPDSSSERLVNQPGVAQGLPVFNPPPRGTLGSDVSIDISMEDAFNNLPVKDAGAGFIPASSVYIGKRHRYSFPYEDHEEMAAIQQSNWDKWGNGIGKFAGITINTFLAGTVGTLVGLGQFGLTGKFSSLYDNPFNRYLDDFNQKMEDWMPNYYTHAEQDAEWYSPQNILTANFWSDKVLKNLGFSIGTLAGGYVGGSVLKSIGLISKLVTAGKGMLLATTVDDVITNAPKAARFGEVVKAIEQVASKNPIFGKILTNADRNTMSVMGTFGEAGMEALQNINETRTRLINEFVDEHGVYPSSTDVEKINQYAERVGNFTWGMNVALLSATNRIQLSKIISSSRTSETAALNEIVRETTKDGASAIEKASAKWAAGRPAGITSAALSVLGKPGRLLDKYLVKPASLFVAPVEGFEEFAQYAIQKGTDGYFSSGYEVGADVSSFWNNLTGSIGNVLGEGVSETLNSKEGMEGMLIGAISGGLQTSFSPFGESNIRERGFLGTGGARAKNTEEAIGSLSKKTFDQILRSSIKPLKDGVAYVNRGIEAQKKRTAGIVNNDVLTEKDFERDYALSYVLPRVKYGKVQSIFEDIALFKEQASSKEGFEDLQKEGIAHEKDTQQSFLQRLDRFENLARDVNSTYEGLRDKYALITNEKGERVYSDEVIEKMTYAISKIADYDERALSLTSELSGIVGVNEVIKAVNESEAWKGNDPKKVADDENVGKAIEAVKAEIIAKDPIHGEDTANKVVDLAEMAILRQSFINDYNTIKTNPSRYKEVVPPFSDGGKEPEKEKITIRIKEGEKEVETGTEYFAGTGIDYEKEGLDAYLPLFKLTILGETEDGKIRIRTEKGEEKEVSPETLEKYKLGRVESLMSDKTARYYAVHRNDWFQYNFGKNWGGKKLVRLEYKDGKLFIVYQGAKGRILHKEVTREHFVAQEGFTEPRLVPKNKIQSPEQKKAEEEFLNDTKKDNSIAEHRRKRIEILNELWTNTVEDLRKTEELIEKKRKELENIQKEAKILEDKILSTTDDVDTRYKKGIRFKSATRKMLAASERLQKMEDDLQKEIVNLEQHKEEIDIDLSYIDDMAQNIDELPTDSEEFVQELKDQRDRLQELSDSTENEIKEIKGLVSKVRAALDSAIDFIRDLINAFEKRFPKVPTDVFGQEWIDFLKANPNFLKRKPTYKDELKQLEEMVSQVEDLDIIPGERTVKELNERLDELEAALPDYKRELKTREAILAKFEQVHKEYQKQKEQESVFKDMKEELLERAKKTAYVGPQTLPDSKEFEADPKKDMVILITSTIGVNRGREDQQRANRFGFRLPHLENAKNIRGVYITHKNQHLLLGEGKNLMTLLRTDAQGLIRDDVDEDQIIAMVMVELQEDGTFVPVDENGEVISRDEIIEKGIYQVVPDKDLTWKMDGKRGESMFRKDTPEETVKSLTEQFGKWRDYILNDIEDLSEIHEVASSFGHREYVMKGDVRDYDARISVEDAGLASEEDLEATRLISIPKTNTTHAKGTVSYKNALGMVFISLNNGIEKLKNKLHSRDEASAIFDALKQLAKNMLDPTIGIKHPKSERLLTFLRSTVYWGIPADKDTGENKPLGKNSVFWMKDEKTKKFVLVLSDDKTMFEFTPSTLDDNRDAIIDKLTTMYNNVNSALADKINEQYEQIISIDEDGTVHSTMWQNYQTYLLSNKDTEGKKRKPEDIPLTTLMRPLKDKEDVNRVGIYFYTTDNRGEFTIPEAKPTVLTAIKGKPKAPKPTEVEEPEEEFTIITDGQPQSYTTPGGNVVNYKVDPDVNDTNYYEKIEILPGGDLDKMKAVMESKGVEDPEEIIKDTLYDIIKKERGLSTPVATVPKKKENIIALDGTKQSYTTKKGNTVFFTVDPDIDDTNFMEKIEIVPGGDLESMTKVIKDSGQDPDKVLKEVIYGEIRSQQQEAEIVQEGSVPAVAFFEALGVADMYWGNQKEQEAPAKEEEPTKPAITGKPKKKQESVNIVDLLKNVPGEKTNKNKLDQKLTQQLEDDEKEPLRELLMSEVIEETEDWAKIEAWIAKNLPNIPIYRVKNIIRATNGKQAWGMLKDGAIYLYENAEVGTVYHEVFEAVWKMFASPDERIVVINEFKSRPGTFVERVTGKVIAYKDATDQQIKEQLAEEFRDYILYKKVPHKPAKGRPFILKLFYDIVNFIKSFFVGKNAEFNTNELFKRIETGYYKRQIPFQTQLSYAKRGIIDIDNAFANETAELRERELVGINDRQRSEIIQQMTYSILGRIIATDQSIFSINDKGFKKDEIYEELRDEITDIIGKKASLAKQILKKDISTVEREQLEQIISEVEKLIFNVDDQWEKLVSRHIEYMRAYSIEFDENDSLQVRDENKLKTSDYQDATKIDPMRKANSAIKLLIATIPQMKINEKGQEVPVLSSIGGKKLLPFGKTFVGLMSNLHTARTPEEMLKRLKKMAKDDISLKILYKRLSKQSWKEAGIDLSNIETTHSSLLLNAFFRTFRKQDPLVKNISVFDNGEVEIGDAYLSSSANQLRIGFMNEIINSIKSGRGGFFKYFEKGYNPTLALTTYPLNTVDDMLNFLYRLGVSFTPDDFSKLNPAQVERFKDIVPGIKTSLMKIKDIKGITTKTLNIPGRLYRLAELKALASNPDVESTYYNIVGEQVQSFIGNNVISEFSDFISLLKKLDKDNLEGTGYEYLINDVFSEGSVKLAEMYTSTGRPKDRKAGEEELFKVGYVGGISDNNKGRQKEASNLSFAERLMMETALNAKGWYLNLVPGDANLEWMIYLGNSVSEESLRRGMKDVHNIFHGYFISELKLAREGRNIAKIREKEHGDKPTDLRFFKDILGAKLHAKVISKKGSPEEVYQEFEKEINAAIDAYIEANRLKYGKALANAGLIRTKIDEEEGTTGTTIYGSGFPDNMSQEELDMKLNWLTVNYMINNIELHKLIYADPFQYDDELKRIKQFSSPRQLLISNSEEVNSVINRVWNKGFEKLKPGYTDFMRDYFRTITLSDVWGVADYLGYKPYEETDGAGLISYSAYRNFRLRSGDWTDNDEKQFRYDIAWEKKDKGIKLTKDEQRILLEGNPKVQSAYTPLKPIVAGNRYNEFNKDNSIVLDKFSLYPLSYRIIKETNKAGSRTSSNSLRLYNKMQKEDIDYAIFRSARKVGANNSFDLYAEDGKINKDKFPEEDVINVPFSIISVQAEVPAKEEDLTTRGSQITKLVTMDYLEAGVPIDFKPGEPFEKRYEEWNNLEKKIGVSKIYDEIKRNQILLEALMDEGYRTTLKRLGIRDTGNNTYVIEDFSQAATTLREEMLKRETDDNIMDALDDFIEGRGILEASLAYQQVRNILYSIVDKQILSAKMHGGLKVQIPSTLLEDLRIEREVRKNKRGETVVVYSSKDLDFYSYDEDKKKVNVCEIMISRWMDSPMSDKELLDYLNNTEEGQSILRGIAYRIPTQKQNSTDVFKVKQFLPEEFGDVIVIPSALIHKAGSDFDIDKLSIYLKNVYTDATGKIRLVPFFGFDQTGFRAAIEFANNHLERTLIIASRKLKKNINLRELLDDMSSGELSEKAFKKWSFIFKLWFENDLVNGQLPYEKVREIFNSRIIGLTNKIDKLSDEQIREDMTVFLANKWYKESLENAYIESMDKLITDPLNFQRLTAPNSASQMKEISRKIVDKTGKEKFDYASVGNMTDRVFMATLRHAFIIGKYAIGIAAVNQTNHSLAQRQPLTVDYTRLGDVPKEDIFWLGNGKVMFEKFNKVNGLPSLSGIKNKAGQDISDIIGQFIDGYVDVTKDPWIVQLGATPNVAGTWLFLIKLGIPIETVAYFMNQPIILDYLRNIDIRGYKSVFIDDIYEAVLKQWSPKVAGVVGTVPSNKIMEDMLGKELKDMNDREKQLQAFMLGEFVKYAKMAQHLFYVTQGSNYDTASFNDPLLIFKKEIQRERARHTIINSVDALVNNSFLKRTDRLLGKVREAIAEIITSDKENVRRVIQNTLIPYVNSSDKEFLRIAKKVVVDLFDWAVQTNQSLNLEITRVLLERGGVGQKIEQLLTGIRKNPAHPLYNNQVVANLEYVPSYKTSDNGTNNMRLRNLSNKVYDRNNIIYSFRELRDYLQSVGAEELYNDIVMLSVLQSGLSRSPMSFASVLPYEDIMKLYNVTLSKINSLSNLNDFYELGVFQRNNWQNEDIVPFEKARWIEVKTQEGIRKKYNPSMEFLPNNVKKSIGEKKVPPLMSVSTNYTYLSSNEYIVYSWEASASELFTSQELSQMKNRDIYKELKNRKAEMKKRGDYSYIRKGLFKRVTDNTGEPFAPLRKGKEYFIYKAINAWGDGSRANEFYDTEHKSVIDNDFVKVDGVDDQKIISLFTGEKYEEAVEDVEYEEKSSEIKETNPQYPDKPEFNKLPGRPTSPTMTYAGIGSRQTPKEILSAMTELAKFLETKGYTLNTGVTFGGRKEGADLAFDKGAKKKNLFSPEVQGSRKREQAIAKEIHPAPQYLKPGALQLMARNTNQVFGDNLDTPVDFVVFWAKETKGIRPEGGTGQAVEMARRKGIPTINLADSDWREQLEEVLRNNASRNADWREEDNNCKIPF